MKLFSVNCKVGIDCKNAEWGPWRCEGEEDLCKGPAYRYKCIGGDCVEQSPCASNPGNRERAECEKVKNLCQPWWGPWTPWTKCSATCGYMQRKRYRPCTGVGLKDSIKNTCADTAYVNNLPVGKGFVQSDACFLRRLCPRIHGGWSSWGMFSSCSKTCGVGNRKRRRVCSNPKPVGGGMECSGIDTDITECNTGRRCPIHGGWCPWEPVRDCSKPCSGGYGIRRRKCECPAPAYGGRSCTGKYEFTDTCNTFPCPYKPDLTNMELDILYKDLKQFRQADQWLYSNGGEIPEKGDVIILQCPRSLNTRRNIFDRGERFPKKEAYWMFNGTFLNDSDIYFVDDEFLVIRGLNKDNIGFYSFGYIRDPGKSFTKVCFFSIYISDLTITLFMESKLHLYCHSLYFDSFVEIKQLGTWNVWWLFEPDEIGIKAGSSVDKIWITNPKQTPFKFTEHRIIENINERVSGSFSCIIENLLPGGNGRQFITQKVKIKVMPEDKFWKKLKNFLWNNWIPILCIFILTLITTILVCLRLRQEALYSSQVGPLYKKKMNKI